MKTFTIQHTAKKVKTKFKHKKERQNYMAPGSGKTKKRRRTDIIVNKINNTVVSLPPLKRNRIKKT